VSVSASISCTIHKHNAKTTWVEIIKFLLLKGWSINDHGKMSFLPVSDGGNYDWKREPIDEKKLLTLLNKKERLGEPLGICITWEDSNIGGSLQTLNETEFLFCITINRKTISFNDGGSITDVNWYLLKLNAILSQMKDIHIISTEFNEML